MPWSSSEAQIHTGLADTPRRQRLWAEVANSVLGKTGDEGRAVRMANAAVHEDVNGRTRRVADHNKAKVQHQYFRWL